MNMVWDIYSLSVQGYDMCGGPVFDLVVGAAVLLYVK